MVGNQFQWSISIYNRPEDTYSTFGAILTAEDGQWDVTAHRRPWREEPGFFDEAMMGESYTENVRWIGDLSAEVPAPSGNLDRVQNVSKQYVDSVLRVLQREGLVHRSTIQQVESRFIEYDGNVPTEGDPVQMPRGCPA